MASVHHTSFIPRVGLAQDRSSGSALQLSTVKCRTPPAAVGRRGVLVLLPMLVPPALAADGDTDTASSYEQYDEPGKFSLHVPKDWIRSEGKASGSRRVVAFHPPAATLPSVNVIITNLGADFTGIGSLGSVDAFAASVLCRLAVWIEVTSGRPDQQPGSWMLCLETVCIISTTPSRHPGKSSDTSCQWPGLARPNSTSSCTQQLPSTGKPMQTRTHKLFKRRLRHSRSFTSKYNVFCFFVCSVLGIHAWNPLFMKRRHPSRPSYSGAWFYLSLV